MPTIEDTFDGLKVITFYPHSRHLTCNTLKMLLATDDTLWLRAPKVPQEVSPFEKWWMEQDQWHIPHGKAIASLAWDAAKARQNVERSGPRTPRPDDATDKL